MKAEMIFVCLLVFNIVNSVQREEMIGTYKIEKQKVNLYKERFVESFKKCRKDIKKNEIDLYRKTIHHYIWNLEIVLKPNGIAFEPFRSAKYKVFANYLEISNWPGKKANVRYEIMDKGTKLLELTSSHHFTPSCPKANMRIVYVKVSNDYLTQAERAGKENTKMWYNYFFIKKKNNKEIYDFLRNKKNWKKNDLLKMCFYVLNHRNVKSKEICEIAIEIFLKHPDSEARGDAAAALGRSGCTHTVELLINALQKMKKKGSYVFQKHRQEYLSIVGALIGLTKHNTRDDRDWFPWWEKNKHKPEYHFSKETQKK